MNQKLETLEAGRPRLLMLTSDAIDERTYDTRYNNLVENIWDEDSGKLTIS